MERAFDTFRLLTLQVLQVTQFPQSALIEKCVGCSRPTRTSNSAGRTNYE